MNKHKTALLGAAALLSVPVGIAPIVAAPQASAEICAGAAGRHFAAGGCTHIAGDVAAGSAIAAADHPYVWGEAPCYTVEGVPYFTPPGDPC